jgi:hypothetical protein
MSKKTAVKVTRSSVTGRFVTERYGQKHPRITERQTVKKK